jgi:molybdopterin/thiamine biosynthesis adenylyltransferase
MMTRRKTTPPARGRGARAERFARQRLIPGWDQERLRRAPVLVVGAGAIGNEVLKNLALLGCGTVQILDPDLIEESNLSRAVLFRAGDVGRPKAAVAAAACRRLFPGGRFTWARTTFQRWASLPRLRALATVVAATDNFESRLQLNRLCRLAPVDLLTAAVDARRACIEAFPFRRQPGTACYECALPASARTEAHVRRSCAGLRATADASAPVPASIVTSCHAGAGLAAALVHGLLAPPGAAPGAFRQMLDTLDPLASSTVSLTRSSTCPACSSALPVARIACGPTLGDLPADWASGATSDLLLPAPVVLRAVCSGCGRQSPRWQAADEWDDSRLDCPRCGRGAVRLDLRDQVGPAELQALPPSARWPVPYATYTTPEGTVLLEFS